MNGHHWSPISDLPAETRALEHPYLEIACARWNEARANVSDIGRLLQFERNLRAEWAVETGSIERLYRFDRGVTNTLIETGLEALDRFSTTGRITPQEAALIRDQGEALDFVYSLVKDERELTVSFIKELHQLLCRNQESADAVDQFGRRFQARLLKGEWKVLANNPTRVDGQSHEYCPPEQVASEMDTLIRWHAEHVARGVRPEIEASWLHHRFAQIHPFQDGNGRVSRAIASLVFLKAGFLPLVLRDEQHRARYIAALESADQGDLGRLISLFARVQLADLRAASRFARRPGTTDIDEIVRSAVHAASVRSSELEADAQALRPLMETAEKTLSNLRERIAAAAPLTDASHVWNVEPERTGPYPGVVTFASEAAGLHADLERAWYLVQLWLDPAQNGNAWALLIPIWYPEETPGIGAASIVLAPRSRTDEVAPFRCEYAAAEPFVFGPGDEATLERFAAWIQRELPAALNEWQSRL